jgi:hypothetical protein
MSLERRIRAMQRNTRPAVIVVAGGAIASTVLLAVACAADPPAPSPSVVPADVAAEAPRLLKPSMSPEDVHLQEAVTHYYGALPASTTGEHRQLWFIFNPDWTVQQHDIGTEGLVFVPVSELVRAYGKDLPSTRPYSVNASLAQKFPGSP